MVVVIIIMMILSKISRDPTKSINKYPVSSVPTFKLNSTAEKHFLSPPLHPAAGGRSLCYGSSRGCGGGFENVFIISRE